MIVLVPVILGPPGCLGSRYGMPVPNVSRETASRCRRQIQGIGLGHGLGTAAKLAEFLSWTVSLDSSELFMVMFRRPSIRELDACNTQFTSIFPT